MKLFILGFIIYRARLCAEFKDSHDTNSLLFSHLADQLVLRLLWNFTDQRPSPPVTGSIVYSAYNYLFTKTGSSPSSEAHPIADRSILVLLLLHSQAKGNHEWESFRRSVQNLRDEHGTCGGVFFWPATLV
jgi:hypothetical protein